MRFPAPPTAWHFDPAKPAPQSARDLRRDLRPRTERATFGGNSSWTPAPGHPLALRASASVPTCAPLHRCKGRCAAQCRQTAHRPGDVPGSAGSSTLDTCAAYLPRPHIVPVLFREVLGRTASWCSCGRPSRPGGPPGLAARTGCGECARVSDGRRRAEWAPRIVCAGSSTLQSTQDYASRGRCVGRPANPRQPSTS